MLLVKFFKRFGIWLFLGIACAAIKYMTAVGLIVLAVLGFALLVFFTVGAVWMNLFPKWDPRDWLAKRKEKKLMEFTNSREKP